MFVHAFFLFLLFQGASDNCKKVNDLVAAVQKAWENSSAQDQDNVFITPPSRSPPWPSLPALQTLLVLNLQLVLRILLPFRL